MTLNINSSVVQREQRGINVSDENTVSNAGNFDPVEIDALKNTVPAFFVADGQKRVGAKKANWKSSMK